MNQPGIIPVFGQGAAMAERPGPIPYSSKQPRMPRMDSGLASVRYAPATNLDDEPSLPLPQPSPDAKTAANGRRSQFPGGGV